MLDQVDAATRGGAPEYRQVEIYNRFPLGMKSLSGASGLDFYDSPDCGCLNIKSRCHLLEVFFCEWPGMLGAVGRWDKRNVQCIVVDNYISASLRVYAAEYLFHYRESAVGRIGAIHIVRRGVGRGECCHGYVYKESDRR